MNYEEYAKQMKDVEISEKLEYGLAVLWLHPSRLPLGLVSLGDCEGSIIKVPPKMKNGYGNVVPVIAVANQAFSGKENITDIILPSSITMLPAECFKNCSSLKNITLPKTIRHIKEGTFEGCSKLENVFYEGTPEQWKQVEIVHEKHEIEFDGQIPGSPVDKIKAERIVHIPGNDALLAANIHFYCKPERLMPSGFDPTKMNCKDLTFEKWRKKIPDLGEHKL